MRWSWRVDSETAGVAALVAADAAAFLSAFNPSIFTIRRFAGEWGGDGARGDIFRGVGLGAALTLLVAFGGSAVTESYVPMAAALLVLLVIAAAYWWALENPRG